MSRTESPIVAAVGPASSYCLRWNTFSTHLAKGLGTLLDADEFTDVVLACDGKFVKAHKILLSLCSPFLKRLFKTNEVNQNTIVILNNVRFQDLEYIIQFVYHGEVNVQQKDLEKFLKTAELLQIEGLAQPEAEGGLVDDEPGVNSHLLPNPQSTQAITGSYSNATTESLDNGIDAPLFNNASSPGQYKRTKLSTRSNTPPRSRLQSLLTGQSYIPQIDSPDPNSPGSSSKFSMSQDPLTGKIKEEVGEPANGIFVRSEDEEVTELEAYGAGGAEFEDTEEEQEGFQDQQDYEHDETMNSEEFMEDMTGASESGSSRHQQVAVGHSLELKTEATVLHPLPLKSSSILPDHHIRNLLSLPMPVTLPPAQHNFTVVHQFRSRQRETEQCMDFDIRDPLGLEDPPSIILGSASVDEEGKAQCPVCFKFYKNRSSLKVHKSVYHRKGTAYYTSFDESL